VEPNYLFQKDKIKSYGIWFPKKIIKTGAFIGSFFYVVKLLKREKEKYIIIFIYK
jgi:hypothetical protein